MLASKTREGANQRNMARSNRSVHTKKTGAFPPKNAPGHARIRPIIIYPFVQPFKLDGLARLFETLKTWNSEPEFCKPLVIINNQTRYRSTKPAVEDPRVEAAYKKALKDVIGSTGRLWPCWSVDSCAMWLTGLGESFEEATQSHAYHDVFFLIPGDFDFSTAEGLIALKRLQQIPTKVLVNECSICLGEIQVPLNSAKQLIDTYGTYGLLYNWFPAEAKGIRRRTDKPRTEFFAVNYETLKHSLIPHRWYAYEQTLIMLLQNMDGEGEVREIKTVPLGLLTDEEATRSSLAGAMMQVERTERALKLFWRERAIGRGRPNWQDEFRTLDAQSESIRDAAMVILRRVLK